MPALIIDATRIFERSETSLDSATRFLEINGLYDTQFAIVHAKRATYLHFTRMSARCIGIIVKEETYLFKLAIQEIYFKESTAMTPTVFLRIRGKNRLHKIMPKKRRMQCQSRHRISSTAMPQKQCKALD